MQLRMNIQTPPPGLPAPKKPKRKTHANMAMSMTFLMPNFFMKKGIRRMQRVSETWLSDMRALALLAPHALANAGLSLNEVMKVLA